MKRFLLLLILLVSVYGLSGCQKAQQGRGSLSDPNTTDVVVAVTGVGAFPKELAGRWRDVGDSGWEIVFEKDGYISSVVINFVKTAMKPGEKTVYGTRYGGRGVFEPGQWKVSYDHEHRDLAVEVVVKHFYQDMGKTAVEGSIHDFLLGTVSDDGETWTVEWYNTLKITFLMPEPTVLEDMQEPEYRAPLVFKKVAAEEEE